MKKSFLISLLLLLAVAVKDTKQGRDRLQDEIDEFHNIAFGHVEEEMEQLKEKTEQMLGQSKRDICTNGVPSADMSSADYLKAFAKGPCSPTVFVPGILSSKLVATIDCKKLRDSDPETFQACGWSCTNFLKRPNREYTIWIPGITSPASILKPYGTSKRCFAGLFALRAVGSGSQLQIEPKIGVTVDTLGSTPYLGKNKESYECGFAAIENFIPKVFAMKGVKMFWSIKNAFRRAGYRIGMTIQALPYDFRLDIRKDKLNFKFKRVVDLMHEMTGKRVSIVAHSFGNQHVLHYLWKLTQAEKDKKIARYFAVAPPFAGALKSLLLPLGMDSRFGMEKWGAKLGLDYDFYKYTGHLLTGNFNLFPQDLFTAHRDHPYIQAILEKIKSENKGQDPKKGTVMDIFPSINSECVVGFKSGSDKCLIGLVDLNNFGSIKGKQITYDQIGALLREHSYNPDAEFVYNLSADKRYTEMKNPGVQVNILYTRAVPTYQKVHFNQSPKTKTDRGQVYLPDRVETGGGDGAVLTTSALAAGIKWADEFKFKRVRNAKPITFVEMCSSYNRKASIFQDGGTRVSRNEYIGANCNCKMSKDYRIDGESCANHGSIIEDIKVIDFILSSVVDNEVGSVGGRFLGMSEVDLQAFEQNCEMFNGVN